MPTITNLVGLVHKVAALLEELNIKYAIGGAVANNYWGSVRATQDVDVLVFIPAVSFQKFANTFSEQGFQLESGDKTIAIEIKKMRESLRRRHMFALVYHGVKIEVFTPFVPLQDEILKRAQRVPFAGQNLMVTTAEDLILLKLAFKREKDLRDVKEVIWGDPSELFRFPLDAASSPRTIPVSIEPI